MTRQEIEREGFIFKETYEGVTVKALRWVEDRGPFDSDAEAIAAVVAAVLALLIAD